MYIIIKYYRCLRLCLIHYVIVATACAGSLTIFVLSLVGYLVLSLSRKIDTSCCGTWRIFSGFFPQFC